LKIIHYFVFIFFLGNALLIADEKTQSRGVIKMRKTVTRIKTRFTFYPDHYITGPRSSRELVLQSYCDNVINVLNEKPVHTGRVWYRGIKLRDELRKPIRDTIDLPQKKPKKIIYYYFSTGS
jgi:hypothetical protein